MSKEEILEKVKNILEKNEVKVDANEYLVSIFILKDKKWKLALTIKNDVYEFYK